MLSELQIINLPACLILGIMGGILLAMNVKGKDLEASEKGANVIKIMNSIGGIVGCVVCFTGFFMLFRCFEELLFDLVIAVVLAAAIYLVILARYTAARGLPGCKWVTNTAKTRYVHKYPGHEDTYITAFYQDCLIFHGGDYAQQVMREQAEARAEKATRRAAEKNAPKPNAWD